MAKLSPTRKKLRLLKSFATGRPVWCCWQITYACNYRCTFCDYWKEEVNYSSSARAREATLHEIRAASANLAQIGTMIVSLGGGEPFLRRDLADITAAIAQHHFPVVTTNGSLVTEERARELWQAGLHGISVSLDSVDRQAHDANRGVPGAAERARNAIQILSRTRQHEHQRVNLICVLTEKNPGEIEPLLRFAAENQATVTVQPQSTLKRAGTTSATSATRRLAAPNRDVAPAARRLLRGRLALAAVTQPTAHLLALKLLHPNFLSSRFFLSHFELLHSGGVPNCRAGQAFFNVDNFLDVQKCVEFRAEPIGNLRDLSPQELLEQLRAERARNTCQACWYNCRGEVEALYTFRGMLGRMTG